VTPGSHGKADLVAHFLTRPFSLLKGGNEKTSGTICVIATKTIRQGNTRESSLSLLRKSGGEIYFAQRRLIWPGKASVVIAVVAISRGPSGLEPVLDGKKADHINSFMIDAKVEDTPEALASNGGRAFVGSIVSGLGFTFDDENAAATPIQRMHEILEHSPEYASLIKVYVGGQQANNQPEFKPERYVINFGAMTADEASAFPELWSIVESKVKPERAPLKRDRYRDTWWQFAEICPGLYRAIEGSSRVLVANCAAAKYLTFSFLPPGCVYSCTLYVFADSSFAHFCVVQSRVHEVWARMFGSSMKDDLRYTGSTCYENYPFPVFSDKLETAGESYNNERAAVLVKLQLGLTKLSNRLNSQDDHSPEIIRLRELHAAMDKAVLDAYGWSDIVPAYEFSGDYENEDGSAGSVRLNFTEEVRDEILRRLLALHAERLKAEQSKPLDSGKADTKAKKPKKLKDTSGPELF
jgi:hypothetical protein